MFQRTAFFSLFCNWDQLESRGIYQLIETSSVCFDVFSLFSFILFFHPPSFFYTLGIKQVHGRTSSLRTPAKQLRQADLSNTAPTPCLSLSFCCSNIIRQEGTHFLSLAHMEGNHQYTCTLLAPSFFFFIFLSLSPAYSLGLSLSVSLVFVR